MSPTRLHSPPLSPLPPPAPSRSEMERRLEDYDWSKTPLGPHTSWPQSLRTAAGICVGSRFPLWIGWGKDFHIIYNDPFIPILGAAKHPKVFGRPVREVWPEIYHIIGPMLESVFAGRESTWSKDQMLTMDRNGISEETYFTWSFSPIADERGGVGGVFTAATETTERVLSERRLKTLRDLSEEAGEARSAEEACRRAARTLEGKTLDVPFALFYLVEPGGTAARLVGTSGLRGATAATPPEVLLTGETPRGPTWPLAQAGRTGQSVEVRNPADLFGPLPGGPWAESPSMALVHPLASRGEEGLHGFVVTGASPRRPLDQDYRTFLRLVADHVSITVASARAYEEERRRAQALAELDQAKTAFFSNVSHEFRTPLTLLLGPIEDALQTPRGVLEGRDLEAAHRNALRLLRLVNTLLDFSRIEAGRLQASFQRVDLARLTRDLASAFQSAVETAGLRLVLDCPPVSEDVYVDPELWEKILLNLLSNAFKFTFEGELAVRLHGEADHVVLEVSDTGTGIPEREMPRLFERFYRIQGARARSHEGSGIGLALVQELVKLHGGTITVRSVEGKGTTFRIELPIGKKHLPADRVVPASGGAGTGRSLAPFLEEASMWQTLSSEPRTRGPAPEAEAPSARILLADDSADMRSYIESLLRDRWTVESVADGQAALERARANPPDLVISDIMMPRLDGLGLLKALREGEWTRTIPVILLSARAGEDARVEGLDWGADDYLIKPFSSKELIARVSSHLQLARLRKEAESERRRSEDLVRSALGTARMFAWELNLETGKAHVSEGLAPVIGAPADLPDERVWENVHPEDEPALRTEIARAVEKGSSFTQRVRYRRFDTGEWIWLEARGHGMRDPDGKVRRVVGLALDVTEHQRYELALRDSERVVRARGEEVLALMESTPAIIWVAQDPQGRSIVGNRASYEVLRMRSGQNASVTPGEGSRPDHFRIFEGSRELAPEESPIQRALREGREIRNYEERLVFSDDTFVNLLGNVVPLRNADGSVRGAVAAFTDVTKLKSVEAEIRGLNLSLEEKVRERTARMSEALRELETFAYTVAHDLRGPLRSMSQFSEILIDEFSSRLGPEGMDYARRIGRAAERMDHLTRDLLEYSRLARAEVLIEPLQLRSVVQEVLSLLQSDIRQTGAQIELDLSEETVMGNHFLLSQAVTNLIGNALKFTKLGVAPQVRVRTGPAAEGRLRLWIEDAGIGIDPAHHPKLFRVFERLDPQGPYQGTGIGLAIVRKAAERMGGTVGVDSGLGTGSRFWIELPGVPGS